MTQSDTWKTNTQTAIRLSISLGIAERACSMHMRGGIGLDEKRR